ncbi:MAG: hypothetical protein AAF939_08425, partial [Planctomycetota bacterium]
MQIQKHLFSVRTWALCWILCLSFFGGTQPVAGQSDPANKKALDHVDYDKWNTISGQRISNDGKWISYSIRSGKPDAQPTFIVRQVGSNKEFAIIRAIGSRFTFDSKYLVYRVSPDKERLDKLKEAKAKPNELPGTRLEMLDLSTGDKFTAPRVKSFRMPAENSQWLAYLHDKMPESDTVKQKSADAIETYEVTSTGLRRPEKKLKLKARPTTESETKTESLAEKSSTNESSQKKNANPNKTKAEKESPEKESKAKPNRKTK